MLVEPGDVAHEFLAKVAMAHWNNSLASDPTAKVRTVKDAVAITDDVLGLVGSGTKLTNGKLVECVVTVWDIDTGKKLKQLEGRTNGVHSVAVSPDGRRALSGSADESMRLWDLDSGEQIRKFDGHSKCVSGVAFSHDGKLAVSGSWDYTVRLWVLPK